MRPSLPYCLPLMHHPLCWVMVPVIPNQKAQMWVLYQCHIISGELLFMGTMHSLLPLMPCLIMALIWYLSGLKLSSTWGYLSVNSKNLNALHWPLIPCLKHFYCMTTLKLSLSSLNQVWTSRPVTALIANNLCVDILLGLPFLKHNKIVIDHELDTAIDKLSGFDLLHENAPSSLLKRQPKKLMPKQKHDHILYDCRELIKELKDTCKLCRQPLQDADAFEKITLHNPIALIMKKN